MLNNVNLLFTQLSKGRYSLEYFKKFEEAYKFPPFKNPLKEHFIHHNMLMFEKWSNSIRYSTEISIGFHDIPFLSTFDTIRKYYGKPLQYSIDSINGHTVSIASYNSMFQTETNRINLYFFDNELIEIEFVFNDISEKRYRDIFMFYVHEKYLELDESPDSGSICIQDKDKNLIFTYWNGIDFSIKYLSAFGSIYHETLIDYYHKGLKLKSVNQGREEISVNNLQEVFV